MKLKSALLHHFLVVDFSKRLSDAFLDKIKVCFMVKIFSFKISLHGGIEKFNF